MSLVYTKHILQNLLGVCMFLDYWVAVLNTELYYIMLRPAPGSPAGATYRMNSTAKPGDN